MISLTMIPYYCFSNFHCLGMCGPIAALLGRHPLWSFYLVGRVAGFSIACTFFALFGEWIAWEMGGLSGVLTIVIGSFMVAWSLFSFSFLPLQRLSNGVQKIFLKLFTKKSPWTTTLVGLATPLLPCGQSIVVFAFCAAQGDPLAGLLQGLLFSLLTTPSLFFAIKGWRRLTTMKRWIDPVLKISVGIVGLLASFRGLAELEIIPHYTPIPEIHLTLW